MGREVRNAECLECRLFKAFVMCYGIKLSDVKVSCDAPIRGWGRNLRFQVQMCSQ